MVVEAAQRSIWYRIYVLMVLLAICVSNLATRNLPAYLITVPVPQCENICAGVAMQPLCDSAAVPSQSNSTMPTRPEACRLCRARVQLQPLHLPLHPAETTGSTKAADMEGSHHTHHSPLERLRAWKHDRQVSLSQEDSSFGPADLADWVGWNSYGEYLRGVHTHLRPVYNRFLHTSRHLPQGDLIVPEAEVAAEGAGKFLVANIVGHRRKEVDAATLRDAAFYNLADGACLSHEGYGFLVGYGFAAFFALGSIPSGYVSDRRPRVVIVSVSLVVWSAATALQAAGHSFSFLLAARAVMALAQAFAMPAVISIVADYFADRQSTAEAVLSVGLYLGSGCASFSIVAADAVGWRWVVMFAGVIGFALAALLYLTVREPERTEWSAPCAFNVVTHEVLEKSRVARMLLVAASAKMLAAYSLSAYLPIWYSRSALLGYSVKGYAFWNATLVSTGGILSALLGGLLGHFLSRYDARAPCWIGVFGSIVAVPLLAMALLASHFLASMFCLFLFILVSESWFGPAISLLQASVRRSVRGQAISLFLVASALTANLGPALLGILDRGDADIGFHLLWIAAAANIVAAVAFMLTAREISYDPVAAGLTSKLEELDVPVGGHRSPKLTLPSIPGAGRLGWF